MTIHAQSSRLRFAAALLLAFAAAPAFAANNPMTFVGQVHNQQLACLHANAEPGVSPLVTLVRKCGLQPGMPIRQFVQTFGPVMNGDPTVPLAQRMQPYRDRYSDYEYGFFDRIDAVTETALNEAEARRMFADLEAEAVVNLDINGFGGQSILAAVAVARDSLEYWIRYEPIADNLSSAERWPKWLRRLAIVAADIGGMVIAVNLGATAPLAGAISSGASQIAGELIAE
jgi:hypothetical protein